MSITTEIKDALQMAIMGLRLDPTPEERAKIIAACEKALVDVDTLTPLSEHLKKASSVRTAATAEAARKNGARGGRPRKNPAKEI